MSLPAPSPAWQFPAPAAPWMRPPGYYRMPARSNLWALVPLLSGGVLSSVPALSTALVTRQRPVATRGVCYLLATLWVVVGGGPITVLVLATIVATIDAFALRKQTFTPRFVPVRVSPVAFHPPGGMWQSGPGQPGPGQSGPARPGPEQPHAGQRGAPTDPVAVAYQRRYRRDQSRALAQQDPAIARDLRIGRPDLRRIHDDGGLVDVNHVPAEALVRVLDLTPAEADRVIAARADLGGRFSSPEEVMVMAEVPQDRVDRVRDLMLFL